MLSPKQFHSSLSCLCNQFQLGRHPRWTRLARPLKKPPPVNLVSDIRIPRKQLTRHPVPGSGSDCMHQCFRGLGQSSRYYIVLRLCGRVMIFLAHPPRSNIHDSVRQPSLTSFTALIRLLSPFSSRLRRLRLLAVPYSLPVRSSVVEHTHWRLPSQTC